MVAKPDDLKTIADDAEKEISAAADEAALEAARVKYLSRKDGLITNATKAINTVPAAERPVYGQAVNEAKRRVESALEQRGDALRGGQIDKSLAETTDLTLPPRRLRLGHMHPVSRTIRDVSRIFASLGFETVEGPEIETDYYNFEALNIPPGHPARDKFNTLWATNPLGDHPAKPMLFRTHTSPMQIRIMEQRRPPIRVVIPGRCYRYEATDAIRESIFFQYEGLAIDENLNMSDLKGVLYSLARQYFGPEHRVRFRPDYFPFTEPSAEMDVQCQICGGSGCAACKQTGWMEILGSGMVHPAVLENCNVYSEKYTGFAWGMGPERIAMLRHGIPDIRLFFDSDVRFLEQFIR